MNMSEIQKNLIEYDLNDYLRKSNPSTLPEQQNVKEEWLAKKQKKLVDSINKDLLNAFGLEKKVDKDGNVYFASKDKDENGRHKVVI
jgi:acetylglutamate kinase